MKIKRCKTCGTVFSTEVCPKCAVTIEPYPEDNSNGKGSRRGFFGIMIAMPLFIGFIYLIYFIMSILIK
ncbi:MAG: hypothetical protein RRY79_03145 [Clostridia bacterium]